MPEQSQPDLSNAKPVSWEDLIRAEAKKQGVNPQLAWAVAKQESGFNPNLKGSSGELGLMQLMPETAKRRGVDASDPIQNIQGGVGELKDLLTQHNGDVVMALRRYNGSPRAPETKTQPYVDAVLANLQKAGPAAPAPSGDTLKEAKAPAAPPESQAFLEGYPKTQMAVRMGLKALPVAGAIGGGILGGPVGAGLLAGAGEGLKEAVEGAAGYAAPTTLAEQAGNAAMVGGSTAALGAAGKVLPGTAVRFLASPAGRAAAGAAAGGVTGYELTKSPYGAAAGALGGAGLTMGGSGSIPGYLLHGRRGQLLAALLSQAEKKGAVGALDEALGTEVAPAGSALEQELLKRATAQQGVEIPRNLVLTPDEFARLDQLRQAMKPGGSAIGAAYQRFGAGGVR